VRRRWEEAGRPPPPPPEVKQYILRSYVERFGIRQLVETGTFLGETTAALAGDVSNVVSIELDDELHRKARERFKRRRNVTLLKGDSAELLPQVAAEAPDATLFWLDAHYSYDDTARGDHDTPVLSELEAVLARGACGDVILVDDVRVFGQPGWPTLEELRGFVRTRRPGLTFEVADDIVRIYDDRTKQGSSHPSRRRRTT
jgi:predicted O-methyltransferase YrrM